MVKELMKMSNSDRKRVQSVIDLLLMLGLSVEEIEEIPYALRAYKKIKEQMSEVIKSQNEIIQDQNEINRTLEKMGGLREQEEGGKATLSPESIYAAFGGEVANVDLTLGAKRNG